MSATTIATGSPFVDDGKQGKLNAAEAVRMPNTVLRSMDYSGVRLLPGRLLDQQKAAREFYFGLNEDDLVYGFRKMVGLPTPGNAMGGWCSYDSSVIFGQLLSGMARMAKATQDTDLQDKAGRLMRSWAETVQAGGTDAFPGYGGHYSYDKMVCGLVDMYIYGGDAAAASFLKMITERSVNRLDRKRTSATAADPQAQQGLEWYTLSENLYRAFLATGDPTYKDFGDEWLYHEYWNTFRNTTRPAPRRVHAYSHVNSLSSLAAAYRVTGDLDYLQMLKNAYEFVQSTQMFATGGYGPGERLVGYDGELGRSLELHADTAEIGCGSWSGFKLSRYMVECTGEARYADWAERLLYNGIGAALPMADGGKTFYYGDFRIGSGTKYYLWDAWPCCSGTHIQDVADYANQIYYLDDEGIAVSQYIPSEVTWRHSGASLKLTLETQYPESEEIKLLVDASAPVELKIRLRAPEWAEGVTVRVNGGASIAASPGSWATITRIWSSGDVIDLRIPLRLRTAAVDSQHPNRVAIVCGPVVLVEDIRFNLGLQVPSGHLSQSELEERLQPDGAPLHFRVVDPPGQVIASGRFYPYYEAAEDQHYRMYHDFTRNELE